MTIDWQTAAALLLVAASVAFIIWRVVRVLRQRSCGMGCGGCSAKGPGASTPQAFVALENLKRPLDTP